MQPTLPLDSPAPKRLLGLATPVNKAKLAEVKSNAALDSAARAYKVQCQNHVARTESLFRLGQIKSWDDLKIEFIPPFTRAQPLSFMSMKAFLSQWVLSAEARFKATEEQRRLELASVSTKFVSAEETGIRTVGRFKLRPRQRKAIDAIIETLRAGKTRAVICPLEGGEGKSVIGWAVLKYWQENQYFGHVAAKIPFQQAFFATKASVVIDMKLRGKACGVANISRGVEVISHQEWGSKRMKAFFGEEEVTSYNQTVKRYVYRMPPPAVIIIDECQDYKKPGSQKSKYLEAIVRAGVAAGSVFIFMSATPWVTVNDTWLFCIATGREFNGEPLTRESFPAFARAIAARAGAKPSDNDPAAIQEFRREFHDCFVIPPRDPRKVKAYNSVLLAEFESPEKRQYYEQTMDRYRAELERCGKGDSEVNKMTVFGKMRHAEEQCKCSTFAKLMKESHNKGFAPICGVSFTSSVKEIVRCLVFEHGVPRNKISIIWGGNEIVTKERVAKIIGPQIFDQIGSYVLRYYRDRDSMTADEKNAVRKYLRWVKDQAQMDETESQQALRHSELVTLRLDKQTLDQRHAEKEAFQNGDTEYCIFTLSSGGVGIDFDHQIEGVRPREGFFTICYWVEEFMQALYRAMRVATLTDVHQHIVFFKDTIVANHVAPRLDVKIKSVRAGVTIDDTFVDDTIELLAHAGPVKAVAQSDLRDGKDTVDDAEIGGSVDDELEQLALSSDDDY